MHYKEDPLYHELLEDVKWSVAFRRELHKYPELSEFEYQTQEKIIFALSEMGINNFPCAETGVCGVLLSSDGEHTVGLRADIDALPIDEMNDLEYKSMRKGVMHACGHDAHTTIQLGVAKYFSKHPDRLKCNLKFFFQPAEETIGGAKRMIEEGVMDTPSVDFMLGLHVMPYMPVGQIEIREGKLNASSDALKVIVKGKSAHGAYPEQGTDAIVVASEVVIGLQNLISRTISPLDQAVITIGKINGGLKDNIICDEVILTGVMRTTDEGTRKKLKEKIEMLVKGLCDAYGAQGSVIFEPGYHALINDADVVKIMRDVAQNLLGKENVIEKELPSLGVEDFSDFLEHSKGAFYHLGCGFESGPLSALHSQAFIINEESLLLGTYLQIKFIEGILERAPKKIDELFD